MAADTLKEKKLRSQSFPYLSTTECISPLLLVTRVESDHKMHDLNPIKSTSRQHGSNKIPDREREIDKFRQGVCPGSGITYTEQVSVSLLRETDSKQRDQAKSRADIIKCAYPD